MPEPLPLISNFFKGTNTKLSLRKGQLLLYNPSKMNSKDHYAEEIIRLAGYCKALSHPARISILKLLLSKQSCICGDIVKELPLAQSTVSQHLKELKKAGLIQGNITPPKIKYCINKENWKELQETFKIFPG